RLRGVQLFGGFCEAQRFRNADEVAQMTKFHRGKRPIVNRLGTLMQRRNCELRRTGRPQADGPYLKSMTCYQEHIGRATSGGGTLCFSIYEPKRFSSLEREPS